MQLHINEISRHVEKGDHAVLVMDRAGWHTTANLSMPENITPIFLPSRAPELNPVENVWQYLRQNWLSNRVFDSYDAIIDASCEAWQKLLATPQAKAAWISAMRRGRSPTGTGLFDTYADTISVVSSISPSVLLMAASFTLLPQSIVTHFTNPLTRLSAAITMRDCGVPLGAGCWRS